MSPLLTVSNDRTFKVWSIDRLECLYESPQLGQFSLTSSAILESGTPTSVSTSEKNKNSSILALGNCDGKILFYDIDSEYEGKISKIYFYISGTKALHLQLNILLTIK